MTPNHISAFLIGFIFGVGVASLYLVFFDWILFLFCVGMFVIVLMTFVSRRVAILFLFFVLGVMLGVLRLNLTFGVNEYEPFLNQPFSAEGVVATDPNMSGTNQQLTLLPDGFNQYVRASMYTPVPDISTGDRIWIQGQLQYPENFNDFNYVAYLQRWNTYAILKKPRVIVLKRVGVSWRTPLIMCRDFVIKQIKAFPSNEGSLIAGMLIGQRQQPLPDDVANAFKITGLTHIVAVSGFNMTIIATACGALVWYIGRRLTNVLTLFVMFGFVVITGASAAVVRAAIMATIMLVAQLLGRQYASLHSLLIVASIMVLQNPRIVIWDVGFQLSVAATYGVLISFQIKKTAELSTSTISTNSFWGDMLRPTLGAIAMTAPIIAFHFGTFSLIAPLANLLVLPLVPWIMLFGALTLIPVLGGGLIFPAQILAAIVLQITQKLSIIPYASISIQLPAWILVTYYVGIFLYIRRRLPN